MSKMSKLTAVEWLTPKILGLTIELSKRKISQRTCELEIMKLIDQGRAMEREQIEEAYYYGQSLNAKSVTSQMIIDNSISYYNETYKGGEQ